jgi:hypothetical protein
MKCFSTKRFPISKTAFLSELSRTSTVRPSGNGNVKISTQHWWNDNDRAKTEVLG